MADEAENTQPEDQSQSPDAPDASDAPAEADQTPSGELGDESGAEDALDDASAIADDVAAQADEGAEMTDAEAAALAAAMTAISGLGGGSGGSGGSGNSGNSGGESIAPSPSRAEGTSFESPEFGKSDWAGQNSDLELLSDVQMNVRIELGRTRMFVEDVLRLGDGAVVELDKLAGDPVDVYVNDRKVARGEVLVLNDNFCVRISEILDLREN